MNNLEFLFGDPFFEIYPTVDCFIAVVKKMIEKEKISLTHEEVLLQLFGNDFEYNGETLIAAVTYQLSKFEVTETESKILLSLCELSSMLKF